MDSKRHGLVALALLVALAHTNKATAQTPFSTINVASQAGTSSQSKQGMSAANPWLGAQVAYKFGGTEDFADNLLVSARYLNELLPDGPFHLPVASNISDLTANVSESGDTPPTKDEAQQQLDQKAQALLLSSSGARVGLFPYQIVKKSARFSAVLHGEASWKLNAFKNDDDTLTYVNQGRFGGGVEFGIGGDVANGKLPLTVSVTPVITFFSSKDYEKVFGTAKSSAGSFEITGIAPIAEKTGVLFEYFRGGSANAFRVGLVIATGT